MRVSSNRRPPGPLSVTSAVFLLMLLALVFVSSLMAWYNILLLSFLVAVPVAVLYAVYWRTHRTQLHLDTVVLMFAGGFLPAAFVILIVEILLTALFALICFGSEFTDMINKYLDGSDREKVLQELEVDRTFGYYMFLLLLSYVVAGMVEEFAKVAMVRCACLSSPICIQPKETPRKGASVSRSYARTTLVLLIAASLGFSTVENMLYTLAGGAHSAGNAFVTAVLRAIVSLPLHTVCAMLTALMLAKRDSQVYEKRSKRMSWFRVVLPAVIVHGTFDLQAILIPLEMEDYLTEGARVVTVVVLGIVILLGAVSMWTWQWRKFLKDVAVPDRLEDDEEIQRLTVLPDV